MINVQAGPFITFGPMLHWNFGDKGRFFSIAFEVSCWNSDFWINNFLLPSIDAGIEGSAHRFYRIYAELQGLMEIYPDGDVPLGISLGPVIEFGDERNYFGWQGSVWMCALLGVDVRFRMFDEKKVIAPGLMVKWMHPNPLENFD